MLKRKYRKAKLTPFANQKGAYKKFGKAYYWLSNAGRESQSDGHNHYYKVYVDNRGKLMMKIDYYEYRNNEKLCSRNL